MSNTHVMVDLETLDNGPNAAIISIGAVKFDPSEDGVQDAFYVVVDPRSSQQHGLTIGADTVMWWMGEGLADARRALLTEEQIDLPSALHGFAQWFGETSLPLWGNGATFDNVILRNAFQRVGLEAPWKFYDDRCHRTLKSLAPGIKPSFALHPWTGTPHNAVDDARWQALQLQAVVAHLGLRL